MTEGFGGVMTKKKEKFVFTDYELLKTIQKLYNEDFIKKSEKLETKGNDGFGYYIPIDCEKIAKVGGFNKHLIFARLYGHLNHKYSYTNNDSRESKVCFFGHKQDFGFNCINFPYLCSALADIEDARTRNFILPIWSIVISAFAVVISLAPH
jgi:hypothetical protein